LVIAGIRTSKVIESRFLRFLRFQNPKKWFLRFSCFIRFLELWWL